MHKILTVVLGASLLLASCGNDGGQKDDNTLAGKKARLDSLKKQQDQLGKKISGLEEEISKIDTSAGSKEKTKLVALTAVAPSSFTHYIDLQGDVEAENMSYISPRNPQGGVVREIYIKRGDH